MTVSYPNYHIGPNWIDPRFMHHNGPICPSCQRPYVQPPATSFTFKTPYQPKHRKPGPAL